MRKFQSPSCEYELKGKVIKAIEPKMKKVSGTMMAGILGKSPWSSPFTVSCDLLGLAREDIGDKPAVKTGVALEEPIIAYADKVYKDIGSFVSAEKIYIKREGDHASWVSDFDDDTFAGHVDGIVFDADGNDYILEVKTSSNMESWAEGVPEYYFWQIALYNEFICKKDKAYVLLGIVDEDTHRNPMSWVPNERTVGLYEVLFDREEVRKGIEQVREWYAGIKETCTTTVCDILSDRDMETFQHLVMLNEDVKVMRTRVERLCELGNLMESYKEEMAETSEEFESLKEKIKNYMAFHDLTTLSAPSGAGTATVSTQYRTAWDEAAMVADGIDPSKYKTANPVNTLRIKRK